MRAATGSLRADTVVLATEAYTADLPGHRRDVLPMFSTMVVTDLLGAEFWDRAGWSGRECVSAASHRYFYAQRTADDRIALGGRGKVYEFGSGTGGQWRLDARTVRGLQEEVRGLFPAGRITFAHAWGGVLGVPRDWAPYIDVSADHRLARVGGYVGQGVTAAHVAGRTLAEVLTGTDSPLRDSPWIRRRPRRWEPEPLRWIGTHAVQTLFSLAQRAESRRGDARTSRWAAVADRITR
ncbi:NAD(P)/FAD-dependent oxidoreductase [Brevibacterium litoralis]|uniref:NAD(P)/FAD-dependent oxidoreductase n=1 Tax=Brevibacterium litoralis TaxID=3138935 RepID=UPI0032ED9C33